MRWKWLSTTYQSVNQNQTTTNQFERVQDLYIERLIRAAQAYMYIKIKIVSNFQIHLRMDGLGLRQASAIFYVNKLETK